MGSLLFECVTNVYLQMMTVVGKGSYYTLNE